MSNHTPITPTGYVYRAEAAEQLGVGLTTLWRLVHDGRVRVYRTADNWPCYKISELTALRTERASVRR